MDKPSNLLVVDDDALNREILERILVRKGHTVTCAQSGSEALDKIRNSHFDLILLDIMMPEVDGIAVLQGVRSEFTLFVLPVIMVSALDQSDKIAELLDMGANDYVTKPIDSKVLLARVNSQLAVVRAHRKVNALVQDVRRRNKLLLKLFGRYVTDDVARNLVTSPKASRIGGELQEVTLLFADIRDFSKLTARLSPERIITLLNNFYDVMIRVVEEYHGTIDKLMGDEMLVTFGVLNPHEGDAERALACSLAMQLAVPEVNARNMVEHLPEVQIGIGVNSGEAMVGNVGSNRHTSFSVIGKEVSLTAAIEAHAKGGEILISESTFMGGGLKVWVDGKRELHPKGFEYGIMTYRLTGLDGKYRLNLTPAAQ